MDNDDKTMVFVSLEFELYTIYRHIFPRGLKKQPIDGGRYYRQKTIASQGKYSLSISEYRYIFNCRWYSSKPTFFACALSRHSMAHVPHFSNSPGVILPFLYRA